VTAQPAELPVGERHAARKREYLGVGLSCLSDQEVLDAIDEAVATRSRLLISFLNPDYALRAHRSPDLKAKMNLFDIVLADGWGVVLGGRFLGLPVPDRQGNDDIGPAIFEASARTGHSHFLFGSAPGVAARAVSTLRAAYPTLPLVGELHGYWDVERGHPGRYDPADEDAMVERINAAGPDILWVCVPTPLQQNWVANNAHRLDVPVVITGGSYLDHLAEDVDWYPAWMLRMRLGWLYRLYRDPRRLWRRYSIETAQYSWLVVRARMRQLRRRSA
jgi:N-acetylglucosaminyldiphosphoundecaprenol N-acetyl-beta-D-mannosaminyltransferase